MTQDLKQYLQQGVTLFSQGDYQGAISCFDKALEIDSTSTRIWNNKGVTLDKLGRHSEAITCFDMALELDPMFARAWINKFMALSPKDIDLSLSGIEKSHDAQFCYNRALKLDPNVRPGME